ncbi:MAG TPA: hypothetical protein VGM14_08690 [Streptosporangiaceae bacterium]
MRRSAESCSSTDPDTRYVAQSLLAAGTTSTGQGALRSTWLLTVPISMDVLLQVPGEVRW